MKSKDILRTVVITGAVVAGLALLAKENSKSQTRSSCRPGDHVLLDAPLFGGPEMLVSQIKTDGTAQLNTILGNATNGRVFTERLPDLRSKDLPRSGFLNVTSQLNAACENYHRNELASRPRGLQPTNDVWPDRVVQVQKRTADGTIVYIPSRIDEVMDDYYATVQWVDETTGKVVTETVARNSLYMEPLASSENPYIEPGKP